MKRAQIWRETYKFYTNQYNTHDHTTQKLHSKIV